MTYAHNFHANQGDAPMEWDTQLQKVAIAMVQRPPHLQPGMALVLGHLGHEAHRLLWRRSQDTLPHIDTWQEAVKILDQVVTVDGIAENARGTGDALTSLLTLIGHAWRRLDPRMLLKMLTLMQDQQGLAPRLLELEIRHVVHWLLASGGQGLPVESQWQEDVEAAQRWQFNAEIHLRRHPRQWQHAHPDLRFNTFDLMPICSSDQLIAPSCTAHHYGALCNVQVAEACAAGLEAWWLGTPRFQSETNQVVAIGLERASSDRNWAKAHVCAPPSLAGHGRIAANALLARANQKLRAHSLKQATLQLSASARSLDRQFIEWLKSLNKRQPGI